MPPRRKGKKNVDNALQLQKKKELELLVMEFDASLKGNVIEIEENLNYICKQIQEKYNMFLNSIPKECRNLTLEEYDIYKKNQAASAASKETFISELTSRYKTLSSKKRKRVESVERHKVFSTQNKTKTATSSLVRQLSFSNCSRQAVGHSQHTPPTKKNQVTLKKSAMKHLITPKFDPTKPLPKKARIAKPGEIVMSLSGSPLMIPYERTPLINSTNISKTTDIRKGINSSDSKNLSRMNSLSIQVQKQLAPILCQNN